MWYEGEIGPDTLVWTEGMGRRTRVRDMPTLLGILRGDEDEPAGLDQLLARKPKVFVHHGPDGAVGVKPDIMDPSVNQLIDPGFVQEIPNVRLTHTGGHSC